MPKKLKLVIVGIVLIIGAGLVYLVISGKDEPAASSQPANSEPTAAEQQPPVPGSVQTVPRTEEPDSTTFLGPGYYTNYDGKATPLRNYPTTVLFFHAPWCPQCRALEASIKAGQIPDGVVIYKVDYDSNQNLRQQYGVTIQTTLVKLDANGKEAKKFVAYDDPSLESVIKNLL